MANGIRGWLFRDVIISVPANQNALSQVDGHSRIIHDTISGHMVLLDRALNRSPAFSTSPLAEPGWGLLLRMQAAI